MTNRDPLQVALRLPSGARYYRCAFQVNPYSYLRRHHKAVPFPDEPSYNQALIEACQRLGIEVIAVTDHYRIDTARSLITAAREAGLHVFPGFEAETRDGVHFLCLFDPGTDEQTIERVIGDCGVHDRGSASPAGDLDVHDLLEKCWSVWNAVPIAAHVASAKGLLRALSGQARVNAWKHPSLLACSLPGPVSEAPEELRPILQNRGGEYQRVRAVAVLNAQDVSGPEDLARLGASCWIKMSEVSVQALRQAFLDPDSRVRLASDPVPEVQVELAALAWQGGFLDGQAIHFNKNLNVLIGGRGSGKSTLIESLRHVLDLEPLGEDARKMHQAMVREVLGSGTKISLLVRSSRPTKREYRIERTVPNPPVVRNEAGEVLRLTPQDLLPRVEIFGQHEISELAKSPEKHTGLLRRFTPEDAAHDRRKEELRRELERSRKSLLEARAEIRRTEDRLARLPALEESLHQYQEAGLEERLKERSLVVREERVLATAEERLRPFADLLENLRRELPIDRAFLSEEALAELPGREILREADDLLSALDDYLRPLVEEMAGALARITADLQAVRSRWEEREREVQESYERILRELQRERIDGEEFISLRQQIETLRPLREQQVATRRLAEEIKKERSGFLAEWEDLKAAEVRALKAAAKKVSRQLAGYVRVQVSSAGDREPLITLLRERTEGRLSEALEVLRAQPELSIPELAQALTGEAGALQRSFGIPRSQAEKLVVAGPELALEVQELDLPATTTLELNVAAAGEDEVWRQLDELSTGQKATAVLLLLLLESEAPLVIDQPEDDLDNRFITEVVVPKMREEKRRRQFIFSTHNANIPVLGDAELIAGLQAVGEAGTPGRGELPAEHMGSIDARPVRELVGEVLEGGQAAFELRRLKYGF